MKPLFANIRTCIAFSVDSLLSRNSAEVLQCSYQEVKYVLTSSSLFSFNSNLGLAAVKLIGFSVPRPQISFPWPPVNNVTLNTCSMSGQLIRSSLEPNVVLCACSLHGMGNSCRSSSDLHLGPIQSWLKWFRDKTSSSSMPFARDKMWRTIWTWVRSAWIKVDFEPWGWWLTAHCSRRRYVVTSSS